LAIEGGRRKRGEGVAKRTSEGKKKKKGGGRGRPPRSVVLVPFSSSPHPQGGKRGREKRSGQTYGGGEDRRLAEFSPSHWPSRRGRKKGKKEGGDNPDGKKEEKGKESGRPPSPFSFSI